MSIISIVFIILALILSIGVYHLLCEFIHEIKENEKLALKYNRSIRDKNLNVCKQKQLNGKQHLLKNGSIGFDCNDILINKYNIY